MLVSIGALKELNGNVRGALVLLAFVGFMQAVLAMWALHSYEYVYYNPLVKPAEAFELDYWSTSFREAECVSKRRSPLQGAHLTQSDLSNS